MSPLPADAFPPALGVDLPPGRRPALVMVDLVRAYFDPDSALCLPSDTVLGPASRVLGAARAARVPVLHTRVAYDTSGADGGVFVRKLPVLQGFAGGGPGAEIVDAVAPAPGEPVIVKQYASAFFGTSLSSTLASLGVDTLLVAGVSTSGCVRATAVDALQHGLIPIVVRDAVADRASGPHEANLYDLQAKYAQVVSVDRAIAYLEDL
ncbi:MULTISPECIES: isochorismatase family protein [Mumia]|uniref:isochorismatase family protein n=1 Tax=Mumia TaxID=1546255 RepID=UPI002444762D|nr:MULTISPECIES: isochorismatase family protein [unclassified Mumia]